MKNYYYPYKNQINKTPQIYNQNLNFQNKKNQIYHNQNINLYN